MQNIPPSINRRVKENKCIIIFDSVLRRVTLESVKIHSMFKILRTLTRLIDLEFEHEGKKKKNCNVILFFEHNVVDAIFMQYRQG